MSASAKSDVVIAFDTWTLASEFQHRGIYVYAREILGRLREMAAPHGAEVRPFICKGNDAGAMAPAAGFRPVNSYLLRRDFFWRYGGGWLSTLLQRPDVIFSPTFTTLHLASPAPRVTTIHDVTPVLMPNFASEKTLRRLRFLLRRAVKTSGLIAISESCKHDLMRVYGVPESRISVVYLGYDNAHFNTCPADSKLTDSLRKKYQLHKPYIFHHGLIQPRKNLKRLIESFRLLLSRNRNLDLDLVLAGPLGWRGEEVSAAAEQAPGNLGRVVLTGALTDDELATLLKGATLTAIPSLYEGFCLPMVESMACGIPTIAANTSCLPEISANALRYFDPESVEEMAACMEAVLTSEPLKKELSNRGVARAEQFDWGRCGEQTLRILLEAAQAVS